MQEKNRLETKEKRAKLSDKIQKTFVAVFAEYEFDWTTWQNLRWLDIVMPANRQIWLTFVYTQLSF